MQSDSSFFVLGIDPGKSGAIAFLEPSRMVLRIHDMPMAKSTTGKDELDLRMLGQLLMPLAGYARRIGVLDRHSPSCVLFEVKSG